MKKIFKLATVCDHSEGGFAVALDGRILKTPAKAALNLPTTALAEAIAAEWNAQEEEIDPASMPMMTLSSTAIDRVMTQFDQVAADIAAYGGSDLLCYRADDNQPDLNEKQQEQWQPWLDWAMQDLDAPLKVTQGIMHVAQDDSSLQALARAVSDVSAFELAILHEYTSITGSLVLALAMFRGKIDPQEALRISQLDELHQAQLWGEDEEAKETRQKRAQEIANAARFQELIG